MSTAILRRSMVRVRPAPPPAFQDVVDRATFMALEAEWNVLVDATRPEPFYRHEYIRSFLDRFLARAALKVVTGRDEDGHLVMALPLVAGRGSICGIPVRELASPTNVHSLRFDLVAADGEDDNDDEGAARALFRHLAADQSWDAIRITDVPQGGKAWRIYRAAAAAGFPVGAWESQRSPYLELPVSYDLLAQSLSARFRTNLRRRRKRLAEKGVISFERLTGVALSEDRLDECLAIESRGWKGRQGSAANQSEATRGFHLDLLRSPGWKDHLSLFLLKLDGKPIAFHYGLTDHRVYSLVMTSYDERFKEMSPGHLLTEEVLIDCISRGLREFDFLGCDLPWKLQWTRTARPHHWLYIFSDRRFGRVLRHIKFGWAPAARLLLTRWRARLSMGRASANPFP